MEIAGAVLGARARLALESEPPGPRTILFVEFPRSLDLALAIRKQDVPSILNAISSIASSPSRPLSGDGPERRPVPVATTSWCPRDPAALTNPLDFADVGESPTGTAVAAPTAMRTRTIWALLLSASVAACAAESDDDASTDDSNEIVEGGSTVERNLTPPIAPPTETAIGKRMSDVLAAATAGLTAGAPVPGRDGCSLQTFKDASNKAIATRQKCKRSDVVRVLGKDGAPDTVHSDLDGNGAVDQFSGKEGSIVLLADANFDGKVDKLVEAVADIENFSLAGYPKGYREAKFIYRVREDRNRDGKFEIESLVARGQLAPR
jgi:hypothetical protein